MCYTISIVGFSDLSKFNFWLDFLGTIINIEQRANTSTFSGNAGWAVLVFGFIIICNLIYKNKFYIGY